jgi:hypothetical protein
MRPEDDDTIKSHALLPWHRNSVCCGSFAAGLGCICENNNVSQSSTTETKAKVSQVKFS